MGRTYPLGVSDFKDMVTGDYWFVDKTMMIADICNAKGMTLLYTRPRRFGKSINLSMLDYYFNIEYKDDDDIFDGLKISSCEKCREYKNRFPVIRLDFSRIGSSNRQSTLNGLKVMISEMAGSLQYHTEDTVLKRTDAEFIEKMEKGDLNEEQLFNAINWTCAFLEKLYGEKVIVLVDEYDQCIHKINDRNILDEVIEVMTPFMQNSFKTNKHIRFGVVTGVMPLLQTGMMSGFNNPEVCDILSTKGDEYFGFTESEVMQLLEETGNDMEKLKEIKEWYDGYHFGDSDVYNPFSVIKYLDSGCVPADYWNKTTRGGISAELISKMDVMPMDVLKGLYDDPSSYIESVIDSRILYTDTLAKDAEPQVVYSYLAMAGYLKTVYTGRRKDPNGIYRVSMVNKEVSFAFETLVKTADDLKREAPILLNEDIYSMDPDLIRRDMIVLLSGRKIDRSWDHDHYKEFFGGQLDAQWLDAKDEMPKGIGICDIFIPPYNSNPAVILEFKTSFTEDPKDLSIIARRDIKKKGYSSEPLDGDVIEIAVGINGKDVHVRTDIRRGTAI